MPSAPSMLVVLLSNLLTQSIGYFAVVGAIYAVVWRLGRERFRLARIPAPQRVNFAQIRREMGHTLVTLLAGGFSAGAVIGLDAAEIVAHPGAWTEAIHPDDRDDFVQTTAQGIISGAPQSRSYRLRHVGTGAYRMVEDHLTATLHDEGHVVGYEAVVTLAN